MNAVISGSGMYVPPEKISNDELVDSFNTYVEKYNSKNSLLIKQGKLKTLLYSDSRFIQKASGILNRHVIDKQGILDVNTMAPKIKSIKDGNISMQAQMGLYAAKEAIKQANKKASEIDAVIFASIASERAYPGIGVEIQKQLGIKGFSFDILVGCSSVVVALQLANSMIKMGKTKSILIVSAEIMSAQVNFRDRDSHFIFGDGAGALIVEGVKYCKSDIAFEVIDTKLISSFSNNVRNDFGFLNRFRTDKNFQYELFYQQGRKVLKELVPMVDDFIRSHLAENNLEASYIKRFWLHQANKHINELAIKRLKLGNDVDFEKLSPLILDRYGNTSSCGCIIVFNLYNKDLSSGDIGVISAFGAGYSIGSAIVRKY